MSEDTTGLDLFDETATAVGNFPQTLRGYDRGAVDAYVRDVESQLARAKTQLREQNRQLAQAQARAADTDFSKLGGHSRGILRAAESQADELMVSAEHRAKQLLAQARADAERQAAEARLALDTAQAVSAEQLQALRLQLSEQTAAELKAANEEAAAVREFAERRAAQILADAEARAKTLLEDAKLQGEAQRLEVEREIAETRLSTITEKESALAEVKATHEAATKELNELLGATAKQGEEYAAKLDADALTWDQRRQAAHEEANGILGAARTQAADLVATAKHEADTLHEEAVSASEATKARLEADIDHLVGRRKAIVAQLGELSALAGSSAADYGDGEPVT